MEHITYTGTLDWDPLVQHDTASIYLSNLTSRASAISDDLKEIKNTDDIEKTEALFDDIRAKAAVGIKDCIALIIASGVSPEEDAILDIAWKIAHMIQVGGEN